MTKNLIAFCFLLLFGFTACNKFGDLTDAEVVTDKGAFAIPLATAQTSFEELIANFDDQTFVTIDPDGLIRLQYRGDVATKTADEIMEEARNSVPTNFIPVTDTVFALPFSSPEELEVDYAELKGTSLVIWIQEQNYDYLELKVRLPEVFKGNDYFSFDTIFTETPTNYYSQTFFVGDHTLIPDEGTLYIEYEAYDIDGNRVELDFINLFIQNLDFSYVEGYLGVREHDGERDTIEMDFFENWTDGDVYFVDPKIRINLINSFGIPTRSVIRTFDIYTADGQTIPMEADELNIADNQGIDFFYPTLDQIGEATVQTFVFDTTNSNIREVLSNRPVALDYDVDAKTNPDELVNVRGFLTDSSFYKVQVEVEMPLYGSASNFVTVDTFDVNFSDYDELAEAEFKIITDNGTPLDVETQLFFIDKLGEVIDSLIPNHEIIIQAAPINNEGVVVDRNKKITLVDFSAERMDLIQSADRLLLQTKFSTIHNGSIPVRIFSEQDVDIKIGMRFKRE